MILGVGYAGRYICRECAAQEIPAVASSRSPEVHLADFPPRTRVEFDLARPKTWQGIPRGVPLIWCFPAQPLQAVTPFAEQTLGECPRLVVLGSTSAYDVPKGAPPRSGDRLIDEAAPLDNQRPRVQGEEYLRRHHGAIVLRVSGIYGPGRNVLNWIRQGRVGPSARSVNLIHVEDLAGICVAALARGTPGEAYNVSDGIPRRWSEICAEAQRRWRIPIPGDRAETKPGKRISIEKLTGHLGYEFRHSDLYAALEEIERADRQRRARQ